MKKTRYIMETIPAGQIGEIAKTPGEWHGTWIDDNTLFAIAELDIHEIDRLSAHPNCHVFESVQDTTPITDQVGRFNDKRQANGKAMVKANPKGLPDCFAQHGVVETDTIGQAGLKIAKAKKHPFLEP